MNYYISKEFFMELLKRPASLLNSAKNEEDCQRLVENLYLLLISVKRISGDNKGFVNKDILNIPASYQVLKYFKETIKNWNDICRVDENVSFVLKSSVKISIPLNTICFNISLLHIFKFIISFERSDMYSNMHIDLQNDLQNIRKDTLRMLHPVINNGIKRKSISIILNTITGYDSEYELSSSKNMINKLLSIQLASTSNICMKIPKTIVEPVRFFDLKLSENRIEYSEKTVVSFCMGYISTMSNDLRDLLYLETDTLIKDVLLKIDSHILDKDKINEKDNEKDIINNPAVDTIRSVLIKTNNNTDHYLITYPKNTVRTDIKYLNEYSFENLVVDSEYLMNDSHVDNLTYFIELLNELTGKKFSEKMKSVIEKSANKPTSVINYKYADSTQRLRLSINRIHYLCMHESAADLSILSDFDSIKEEFDLVDRSFVTRGKPISFPYSKSKIHIRDTILIAPAGAKSLQAIGSIYGDDYKKIDIGKYRQGGMSDLLREDKELFTKYGIRDAEITLKHAVSMEEFHFTVDKLGVPLTISSIGNSYVLKEWSEMDYSGYQIRSDIMIGNLTRKLTPKIARSVELSKFIVPYIEGYRGGRNESMMYGIDRISNESRSWIDYDLTSCYTTVMSLLGHPRFGGAIHIGNKEVSRMRYDELLFNYIMLDVDFKFPNTVKYPCIPTTVDDDVDIYPLEGRSVITGCEYYVAKSMNCELTVREGVFIPFETDPNNVINKDNKGHRVLKDLMNYRTPFRNIMSGLQAKRRKYPKKTFLNYMFKDMGNAAYGQVAMGVSGRTGFDIKSKVFKHIEGGALSNPILSSYITGFNRALIGECMNNISLLGGQIVSVTTDGFITNISDLESKLVNNDLENKCLLIYKELRKQLTSGLDDTALEIKTEDSVGIISWKTRGQLGLKEGGIKASTGFQTKDLEHDFLVNTWSKILENSDEEKSIEYVMSGLRSGKDIYKHGGHVQSKYSDRKFSMEYDNKRRIIVKKDATFYDSVPWESIIAYKRIRVFKNTITTPVFTGFSTQVSKSYKSYLETGVRGFIKACLALEDENRYGIPNDYFSNYQSIINFIKNYEPAKEVKMSLSSISKLKQRQSMHRAVPRTSENELFINYVKTQIKSFNTDLFFKQKSTEVVKINHSLKMKNKRAIKKQVV